ncbi:MAG: tetratricopeptide repeat protein [Leptospiraceae bacterium]|nr:tetratricopeptide repeat protein [Leptospiraceae bacterium]
MTGEWHWLKTQRFPTGTIQALLFIMLLPCLSAGLLAQTAAQADPQPDNQTRTSSQDDPFAPTQASRVAALQREAIAADARRRFLYLRELAADGHQRAAIRETERFLLLYPDHPDRRFALKLIADALRDSGENQSAAVYYQQVWREFRNHKTGAESGLTAARLLADSGQFSEAREILQEIIQERPSSVFSRQAENELHSYPLNTAPANGTQNTDQLPNTAQNSKSDTAARTNVAEQKADTQDTAADNNPETPLIETNDTSSQTKTQDKNKPTKVNDSAGDGTQESTVRQTAPNVGQGIE